MTAAHTTVLEMLGKEVSFSVLLDDQQKCRFPEGVHVTGYVQEVIIALDGNHQILVSEEFYELSRIVMKS